MCDGTFSERRELSRAFLSAGLAEQLHELRLRVRRCRRIANSCGADAAARAVDELADRIEAEAAAIAAQVGTLNCGEWIDEAGHSDRAAEDGTAPA